MKQTSIEWFMEKIGERQPNGFYVINTLEDVENVFNEAKEMHERETNEKINLSIQEFERLKSKAQSLKDIMYFDGVLAVLEGIKNQLLKKLKQ